MFVRAYLRASTSEQDANRARGQLRSFAKERGLTIAAWYVESESGAKLARPELFRLLADAHPGDILLVEQVDRLSRLTAEDWERLKSEMTSRRVRVVALDLPTSWMMATNAGDEFTGRMFEAINGMLLDMLAAVARKDYDDRRRRQAQGQAKAKAEGRYKGRPEDVDRNAAIGRMLALKQSWGQMTCHRSFIQPQLESCWVVRRLARVEQRAIGGAGRDC
ncbi:recombinase family protein, partial [Bradyrhizobium sp. SZCCHNR3056]